MSLLRTCRNLTVDLPTAAGLDPAGERCVRSGSLPRSPSGLVGESGSGKTMLALALMGLLPPGARVGGAGRAAAQAERAKATWRKSTKKVWRAGAWPRSRHGFSEPMTSLNPVMAHRRADCGSHSAHEPALSTDQRAIASSKPCATASVPEPEVRAGQFPHQPLRRLRQRAMIAMPWRGPKLLIADEPNHRPGRHREKQILDLLDRLRPNSSWPALHPRTT